MKRIPQDIVGDIAILKFSRKSFWLVKKIQAFIFLKKHKNIKVVLEKVEGFSGKLRTLKTRYLAGERTKEAFYKENGCVFVFNVEGSYFSPRLSNERKIIAEEIVKIVNKKKTKILVMFAGVSPYPIVIAKKLIGGCKKADIFSNELNEEANFYGRKNIDLNNLGEIITLVEGDARVLPKKLKIKFDVIVMARPNLEETFLDTAFKLSKKGTIIFYHGFGTREKVLEEIKRDGKRRIGKILIRKAGDIGVRKYRWQARFKVLS